MVDTDDAGDLAASSNVLLVVDDEGRCVDASLGACRLLGVGREEALELALRDLFEPASRERLDGRWPAALSHGGRIGSFALISPHSVEIEASVKPNMLPGRHLVVLEALTLESDSRTSGRFSVATRGPSAREREVLDMLADGATDEQIASRLALSPATVQTHVRNAKAKLGARTRAQAVALAFRHGLIGNSPREEV